MKKFFALLAVVALTAPAMAAVNVWIEADGTVMMEATDSDTLPVGLALEVDANDGGDGEQVADFVSDNSVYNANIDDAFSNPGNYNDENDLGQGTKAATIDAPGVASLPADAIAISTGILGADPGTGPLALGQIVLSSGAGDVCLSVNDLRGGLVAADGSAITPVFTNGTGACGAAGELYSITGDVCDCLGDISSPGGPDIRDGIVSTSDLSNLIGILSAVGAPFIVDPIPAGKECMDLAGPSGPGADGVLSTSDLSAIIGYLSSLGAPFSGPCIP